MNEFLLFLYKIMQYVLWQKFQHFQFRTAGYY